MTAIAALAFAALAPLLDILEFVLGFELVDPFFKKKQSVNVVGKLRAMTRPKNHDDLLRWLEAFAQLDIPLIVKFHGQDERAHLLSVLRRMAELPVFGVHVNVRDEDTKCPNVALVRDL